MEVLLFNKREMWMALEVHSIPSSSFFSVAKQGYSSEGQSWLRLIPSIGLWKLLLLIREPLYLHSNKDVSGSPPSIKPINTCSTLGDKPPLS